VTRFAAAALVLVMSAGAANAQSPERDPKLWERAVRVHRSAVVVDTHSDTTSRMLDEGFDVGSLASTGHMDLPRMKEGGLDAQFFAIYVDTDYMAKGGSARRALDMIDVVYRQVARHADTLLKLRPEREAIRAKHNGDPKAMAVALEAFDAAHPLPRTPFKVLVDHIDHIAKVAGVDHVGLGSDFDGGVSLPEGMRDVRDLPEITYALLERGYSDEDVRKILGGNILRVMGDVERTAAGMRKQ
jgi:microsomal dipeptidase-like Zn-dependent dipeptidase